MPKAMTALASLAILMANIGPATSDTYTFWLKAFIPNVHPSNPGYILANPAGGTMIRDPVSSDYCYTTDNRGFSASSASSARITSTIKFSVTGGVFSILQQAHATGPTHRVMCQNGGNGGCSQSAGAAGLSFSAISFEQGKIFFTIRGGAFNPCVPNIPDFLVPKIHYDGQFTVDTVHRRVGYVVTIGGFPAFEAYVQKNNAPPSPIFRADPARGSTVLSVPDSRTLEATTPF